MDLKFSKGSLLNPRAQLVLWGDAEPLVSSAWREAVSEGGSGTTVSPPSWCSLLLAMVCCLIPGKENNKS